MFLSGKNTADIAEIFLARQPNEPSLQMYNWSYNAVARILKNEKYIGDSLWQKAYKTQSLPRKEVLNNKGKRDQYYVRDTHPAIIERKVFNQVQTLLQKRAAPTFRQNKIDVIQEKLVCGCCGSRFRKKESNGITYYVCCTHAIRYEKCLNRQLPREIICNGFLRVYAKLQRNRKIQSQLLTDLQAARTGKMLWSADIVELNNQIADITRQDRLLTQLKQQGLVDPDIFISRRDGLAEQLRAVKLEKERLLGSEEDQTIQQTQALLDTLEAGPEFLDTFDGELFRELVDKIIVESNERLRFRLINGLELTETIERTVR